MKSGALLFTVILFLPILLVVIYGNFIKYLCFNKISIVLVSIIIPLMVYMLMVYLCLLLPENLTLLESFAYMGVLFLTVSGGAFPWLEDSFKKAYYSKRKVNSYINKDNSDVSEYLKQSRKVIIIALLHKVALYGLLVSFLGVFLSRKMYGIDMNHATYGWMYYILASFCALFICCIAFLRIMAKCPNCGSDFFLITTDGVAFFQVSNQVLKDKVIDCMICSATYALDPKLDLDDLRRDKKKRIEEGKFITLGPDGRKRTQEINNS